MSDPFKKTQADLQPRGLNGKFSKLDPPWVSFSITNPITYIRKWWKAVMDGEGVDLRLKVHPLTAVALALAIGGVSFSIGRISVPSVIARYIPVLATIVPTPIPTSNPWREAAFVGSLQEQDGRFYLLGSESQAILLEVPENVSLNKFVGRRILASGYFDPVSLMLRVRAASDLEIITGSSPVPTIIPSLVPSPSASAAANLE